MILPSCRKSLCLSGGKSSTWRYCKDMQTYFGYFGHTWLHSAKMMVFNVYLHAKNKLHNSLLSWDITKILSTGYFWYFGLIWLLSPKVILPSYRKHLCLSASKTSTLSPILLWRYCKDMKFILGTLGMLGYTHSKW